MTEFELIRQFFLRPARRALLGGGDDCALLTPRAGHVLAVSTDMLVEGRHFFADVDPAALGYKCLAVNLSDLAAMTAEPLAFTLALALPDASTAWLENFSRGLFECADRYDCELIGGDTTRGPLTISITVLGEVPLEGAARRDAACVGDDVWVSGSLGGAALGLAARTALRHSASAPSPAIGPLLERLERPTPRVALGIALRGSIHAMIDVSDGLLSDLRHITDASGCGALIRELELPIPDQLARLPLVQRRRASLAGGDDYELCFTAALDRRRDIAAIALDTGTAVTRIGEITAGTEIRVIGQDQQPLDAVAIASLRGFDHFG